MKQIEQTLVPEDENWLVNFFADEVEAFDCVAFFTKYIKERFPEVGTACSENVRAAFLIEGIDVQFSKKCHKRDFRVGFGEGKIKLLLPDHEDYDEDKREEIVIRYEERYTSVIKESQVRTMALFWRMLSFESRQKIQEELIQEAEERRKFKTNLKEERQKNQKTRP